MNLEVDVAIVGAGISGLSAAWELYKSGIESIVVLEARSRVGGRTLNESLPSGSYVEQGGTWAGIEHTRFLALAKELGVATKLGQREGDFLCQIGDRWKNLDTTDAFSSQAAQEDFKQVLSKFERLRRTLPTASWQAENAAYLDSLTMQEWIEQNTTTIEGREWFSGCVRQTISGELSQVSLLWILHFFNTTGDIFLGLNAGAEGIRFVGGSQQLSLRIAEKLGDRVTTDAPVTYIQGYDSSQVRIKCHRGTIVAKAVIVAMMPKDVGRITFDPPLPPMHQELIANWQTMSWVKFYAIYEKPFWHHKTTGSHFLSFDTKFDVYDVSPEDSSQGIIVGLLPSDRVRPEKRQAYYLDFLAETFGEAARYPQELTEFDWNDRLWTGGCVSALLPGVLSKLGTTLNQSVGKVYWAGTERSPVWTNYIEGAIYSGQQTALEVLQKLQSGQTLQNS